MSIDDLIDILFPNLGRSTIVIDVTDGVEKRVSEV